MPAYVIAEVEVTDPEKFKGYQALAPDTIAQHGGRYLARGGKTEVLEGTWPPRRTVLLEFPSVAAAQGWYNSPAYKRAIEARRGAATLRALIVEGLQP